MLQKTLVKDYMARHLVTLQPDNDRKNGDYVSQGSMMDD